MAEAGGELTVAQRLGRLLDRGLLPAGGPAEAAERLIDRLERQARVALLGLPGSGKSAILNLLAGTVVVPETLRLPTIIVQHGLEPKMVCTLADGRTEVVPGSDLANVLRVAPAMVTMELDVPALKVITLLEVSAGPMEAEQRRAATWAAKRADIIIWCTTSYLPKEQVVWEDMPDVVKDNGFLFLTKVDLLGSKDAALGMLERVEMRAGEEFRQVLAISAKQARQALHTPGGLDRELFRDSGAGPVITAIKSRVQMARQADTDMAEMLLARHVEASEMVARRFAEMGDEKPPEWVPPPDEAVEPEPAPILAPEVVAEPEPVVLEPEPESEPEPELSAQQEPEPEPEPTPELAAEMAQEPVLAAPLEVEAPAPPVVDTGVVAEAEPTITGRKRFSDRLRQDPAPDQPAAPQVPLRSTWKSKAEIATAPAQRAAALPPELEPEPVPEPEPVIAAVVEATPEPEPIAEVAPEPEPVIEPVATTPEPEKIPAPIAAAASPVPETDDERIARMIAAAAAQVQRSPRERLSRAERGMTPAPRSLAEPPAPGADSPAPDGADLRARRPGADPEDDAAEVSLEPASPVPGVDLRPMPEPAPEPAPDLPRIARLVDRADRARPERAARDRTPGPPITNVPLGALPTRAEPLPQGTPRVERRERPRIAARAAAASSLAPSVQPVADTDVALVSEAIELILARTADLVPHVKPEEKVPVDLILDHGRETTERLMAVLSRGTSPALRRIMADLGEVLDLIMLMQLEKGHAPADDTLSLLLQLRRELETLRAA